MTRRNMIGAGCLVLILVVMAGALGAIVRSKRLQEQRCAALLAQGEAELKVGRLFEADGTAKKARYECSDARRADVEDLQSRVADDRNASLRIDEADKEWAAYDALQHKTKDALIVAFNMASAHGVGLGPTGLSRFKAYNEAMRRERLAPLLAPRARTTGKPQTTLILSSNPDECRGLAREYFADAEGPAVLRALGFTLVHCDNPDADWPLQ